MLKLENIHAAYHASDVLQGINFEVPQGKIVTLLGSNGAGKSTTLKVISCLLRPNQGSVLFEDQEITHLRPEKAVELGVVHVPEGRRIFPQLSVLENLKIGSYTRKDRFYIDTDIQRMYEYFPVLADRKNQVAGTLSGGEQQMLAIARGLMAQPKLLLLDEPSLGLAPLIVQEIFRMVKLIREEGTTILLVEQNAYQALSIADYGYILENGRIVLEGPCSELRENEEVKNSYLGK
jgi:branched-chain amino acid transport system ATP-binding protein